MKKRLLSIAIIAAVAYVIAGVYLAGFYPAIAPQKNASLQFGNGTLYGRKITSASWQASYESITANADDSILSLEGVHDGIVDRGGKPYLNVRAKHLLVNVQTHDFQGSGGVHVASLARDTTFRSFDTQQIAWSNNMQRLTVDGQVSLNSTSSVPLVVDGLTYDVKTGELHLGKIRGAANFK